MSQSTDCKQSPSYVDTRINRATVMETIKKCRRRKVITGTTVSELARGIRRTMNAHPACTRKIEEILVGLIADGMVVHRFGFIRAATRQERMDASATPKTPIPRKVHKTRKRVGSSTVVMLFGLSTDNTEDDEPEQGSEIPDVWAEFPPGTAPDDERLLAACGISA